MIYKGLDGSPLLETAVFDGTLVASPEVNNLQKMEEIA